MTPWEHFAEAEKILADFDRLMSERAEGSDRAVEAFNLATPNILALAQVHATLATLSPHTHASPVPRPWFMTCDVCFAWESPLSVTRKDAEAAVARHKAEKHPEGTS